MEQNQDSPARNTRSSDKGKPLSPTPQGQSIKTNQPPTPIPDKFQPKRRHRARSESRKSSSHASDKFNELILEKRSASRGHSVQIKNSPVKQRARLQLSAETLNKLKQYKAPSLTIKQLGKQEERTSVSQQIFSTCESITALNNNTETVGTSNSILNSNLNDSTNKEVLDVVDIGDITGISYLTCEEHNNTDIRSEDLGSSVNHINVSNSGEDSEIIFNPKEQVLTEFKRMEDTSTNSTNMRTTLPTLPALPEGASPTESVLYEVMKMIHGRMTDMQCAADQDREIWKKHEEKIAQLTQASDSAETERSKINDKVSTQNEHIHKLTSVIHHQEEAIDELKQRVEELEFKSVRDSITIGGIIECEGENVYDLVTEFFQDVLMVEEDIPVLNAYRLGEKTDDNTRPIQVKLSDPGHKGLLFKYVSNIQNKVNEKEQKFTLGDQVTGERADTQRWHRDTRKQNKKLTMAEKLKISVKKGNLFINNERFEMQVQCPRRSEFINVPLQRLEKYNHCMTTKLTEGEAIQVDDSKFIGYSAEILEIQDVVELYETLRFHHLDAKHIVCAYRLPGRQFPQLQAYKDDGETGAGRRLLYLMRDADIMNRVIFVVRYYKHHIGAKRFIAYKNAASSAICRKPYNSTRKELQTPWDPEEIRTRQEMSNRGRRPNRGYRGSGTRGGRNNKQQKGIEVVKMNKVYRGRAIRGGHTHTQRLNLYSAEKPAWQSSPENRSIAKQLFEDTDNTVAKPIGSLPDQLQTDGTYDVTEGDIGDWEKEMRILDANKMEENIQNGAIPCD